MAHSLKHEVSSWFNGFTHNSINQYQENLLKKCLAISQVIFVKWYI